uniref:Uncharacterized protein n=1 Tax=Arundo donax TaxID=35708 RepID=A0A0A9EIY4_ARUDO
MTSSHLMVFFNLYLFAVILHYFFLLLLWACLFGVTMFFPLSHNN